MCLILLAWRAQPGHELVVAANRDEFHGRPAAAAAFWADKPGILAGRDLEAKGTWMGVARDGRFAAVTNYRGATEARAAESRGALATGFLERKFKPSEYVKSLDPTRYSGFNLLVADDEELWWMSNRNGAPRRLEPGYYGLGNLLLDSPEVEADKARFRSCPVALEPLFSVLAGARVVNPHYGTRCSTILLRARDGRIRYAERSFATDGSDLETLQFEF